MPRIFRVQNLMALGARFWQVAGHEFGVLFHVAPDFCQSRRRGRRDECV